MGLLWQKGIILAWTSILALLSIIDAGRLRPLSPRGHAPRPHGSVHEENKEDDQVYPPLSEGRQFRPEPHLDDNHDESEALETDMPTMKIIAYAALGLVLFATMVTLTWFLLKKVCHRHLGKTTPIGINGTNHHVKVIGDPLDLGKGRFPSPPDRVTLPSDRVLSPPPAYSTLPDIELPAYSPRHATSGDTVNGKDPRHSSVKAVRPSSRPPAYDDVI